MDRIQEKSRCKTYAEMGAVLGCGGQGVHGTARRVFPDMTMELIENVAMAATAQPFRLSRNSRKCL